MTAIEFKKEVSRLIDGIAAAQETDNLQEAEHCLHQLRKVCNWKCSEVENWLSERRARDYQRPL